MAARIINVSDAWWLSERPSAVLSSGVVALAAVAARDVAPLVEAVNASLDHLRPWMPWAQEPATQESIGAFVNGAVESWEACREFQFTIRRATDEAIVGCCGLHTRVGSHALEIGYWVHVDHVGKGLASAAARCLTKAALKIATVQRVEIHCDAANGASAAIPKRLGYRLDRIESREPETPGETGQHMVWIQAEG